MKHQLFLLVVLVLTGCNRDPVLPPPGSIPAGLTLWFSTTNESAESASGGAFRQEYYTNALGRVTLSRRIGPKGNPVERSYSWDQTAVTWEETGPAGTVVHVVSWDEAGLLHRFWPVTGTGDPGKESVDRYPKVGQAWGPPGTPPGTTLLGGVNRLLVFLENS